MRQMSCARLLGAVSAAVALALVSGCGRSTSGRDSASSPHSGTGSQYRTYAGSGFSLWVPAGWRQEGAASAPDGATGLALAPPDHSASLDIHVYPHSNQGVDQTIATTLGADELEASQGAIGDLQSHVRTPAIKGASAAKELTESYTNKGGRQRYTGLVVLSASGKLIVIETIASARAPASYPAPVFDSFRLLEGGPSNAA